MFDYAKLAQNNSHFKYEFYKQKIWCLCQPHVNVLLFRDRFGFSGQIAQSRFDADA